MPITLSQLAAKTATVVVEDVTIHYYPNKITTKLIADLQASGDDNSLLETVIASWDIMTDEDSTVMFPIARMAELGVPFKVAVINAFIEALRPNSATA